MSRMSYRDCLACGGWHNVKLWPIGDGSRMQFFVCPTTKRTLVADKGVISVEVVIGPDVAEAMREAGVGDE